MIKGILVFFAGLFCLNLFRSMIQPDLSSLEQQLILLRRDLEVISNCVTYRDRSWETTIERIWGDVEDCKRTLHHIAGEAQSTDGHVRSIERIVSGLKLH